MHPMRALTGTLLALATLGAAGPAYADLCEGVDLVTSRVGHCSYGECETVWVDPFKDVADEGIAVSACDEGRLAYVCVANGRQYRCTND